MSVHVKNGNLFEADAQAIVITVNCVGAMGKGVALEFKKRWPHLFNIYYKRCRAGKINPGEITKNEVFQIGNGRYAILMPTKFDWRKPSELQWIKSGVKDLRKIVDQFCLETVAMPPAGCGNGGLDFSDVLPFIKEEFDSIPDVELTVCL